jgi:hypothetical protein
VVHCVHGFCVFVVQTSCAAQIRGLQARARHSAPCRSVANVETNPAPPVLLGIKPVEQFLLHRTKLLAFLLVSAFVLRSSGWRFLIYSVAAMLNAISSRVLKRALKMPRPFPSMHYGYGMPSSHAQVRWTERRAGIIAVPDAHRIYRSLSP